MIRQAFMALLAAIVCGVAGCGSGDPWSPVAVTGRITYEDGGLIPAQSIQLTFAPQTPPLDEKTFPRQGKVGVNTSDGTFGVPTTYTARDGLIPGKHKVVVVALEGGRNLSRSIPRDYASVGTTPLVVDTADAPLHIEVSRP